ncbi:MAG: elongation factor G [Eubacteriales bacterium]|nr:elongation factor G [Eubacteriales bacterium]
MKAYDTKDIRNVVLMGHGGSGKSTIVEALAYCTGITTRMGKVADGNSISDYDKEEQKRQFSISTSLIPVDYNGTKINLLDAPGYFDFVGEVEEALSVADAAIIVVNAKAGIQPGTRKAWDFCEDYNLPRFIFITGMDDAEADFQGLLENLSAEFGTKISPLQVPIRENGKLTGYVNVVKVGGRKWLEGSKKVECEIPADCNGALEVARNEIMEAVAETSEELMEKFFNGEEFTSEEISAALRSSVATADLVPVLIGSGINAQGMDFLMQVIVKYAPAPQVEETNDTSLVIWKTLVDPFIGKYSMFKVMSGTMKSDMTLMNVNKETEEKCGKLFVLRGKEAIETPELKAGDIGALSKLSVTSTGDTLAPKGSEIKYDGPQVETPYTYLAYKAVNKGEDDKVAAGISKLLEEDKTLRVVNDSENRQSLLYGIGEQQLEIVKSKLENRYKVKIELSKPKFAYRETIRKKVEVRGRHKKQSGGHGQFGDVLMEYEPSGDLTTPYVFEEKIFGGSVPKNFFPAVEKGIQECVLKGPVAGYPVVGVKATLTDGSYHPVDSNEMSFKMASTLAFKDGFMKASPVILEPIATLKVTVPDSFTGDVMGDLNKRRGRVLGMNAVKAGKTCVEAEIPMSELFGYGTDLRSMTGGIGSFAYEFARYEQAPQDVMDAVIASADKDEE